MALFLLITPYNIAAFYDSINIKLYKGMDMFST